MDAVIGPGEPAAACAACGEPLTVRDRFCEGCGRPRTPAQVGRPRAPEPDGPPRAPGPGGPPRAAGPGWTAPLASVAYSAGADPLTCADCGSAAIGPDGYCDTCGLRQPSGREHVEIEVAAPGGAFAAPIRAAGVSDRGLRRPRNEDAFALATLADTVCAVVCDGVASAPGSEEAARVAAETAVAVLARRLAAGADARTATRTAASRAGEDVAALAGVVPAGAAPVPDSSPACTYVSAIVGPGTVTIGWIGDSRAYWLPHSARAPELLTKDDSWAVRMVARGTMTEAAAWADPRAHLLTAWLGADAGTIDPHLASFEPAGPGLVLICSDGLWNDLPEAAGLAAVALDGPAPLADPLAAAGRLLRAALDAGGHDNVTAALIPFPPPHPTGPPPAAPAETSRETRR
ncbi:PP2C family protein-serine/threonine phosphatase [Actinomadura xylanilytica]|uniref:PP2C family protein-serine/threonine phosphatase n=1 Tax=Actinomadura xylanilytica TaxID=887459 RepID=UPI00255AB441|nr:protein phosphatase 2C domain-containing protein [Actinomadura xylanilytica]MDL4773672.1 protein phosphatase 2C domain-containing protein [Actinomadura xylanilytica]